MHRQLLILTSLALTGTVALAQSATHRAPTHHTTTAHTAKPAVALTPAGPLCATLPTLSDKIPALPANAGCPTVLFTVSDRLDYLSPIAQRFKQTLFAELPVVISLDYADIAIGTGELALPQHFYTVKYTGYLPDGSKFDSSEDHEEIKATGFTFPYGAHRVIAGWDLGFEGMHIGGKRRLYIPYQFGYGAGGQPPKIPPKSMLIFDMELVAQSEHAPAPPTPPAPPSAPTEPNHPTGNGSATPGEARPSNNTPQTGPDVKPEPPVAGTPNGKPAQPTDTKPQPPHS